MNVYKHIEKDFENEILRFKKFCQDFNIPKNKRFVALRTKTTSDLIKLLSDNLFSIELLCISYILINNKPSAVQSFKVKSYRQKSRLNEEKEMFLSMLKSAKINTKWEEINNGK